MSNFGFLPQGLHEECGVFGIYDRSGETDMVSAVYSALYALQHRGQESCGLALNVDGVISGYRDLGLVSEVFTQRVLNELPKGAKMAAGHVRYATAGSRIRANAQPMVIHHNKGAMALCHNGNLTNASQLRHVLEIQGSIFHGTSDTEVISYLITKNRLTSPSIEKAVALTMNQIEGAYSLVIMSPSKLIAARDPNGFRPLCVGQLPEEKGWVFASESCALDAVGAEFVRDVEPGEILVADRKGLRSLREHCGRAAHTMCVFEYVYFARPDSVIEGTQVHEARKQAGRFLAQEHPVKADVVIGVPDSGLDAALGYSEESGIPYGVGFIKNKYVGRTFIQGSQVQREASVRIKLNVIPSTVKGKDVVLIDDSIVRGTTSARIIRLLRDAGAKSVHFRVSAPPFTHPCFFGTDIPDERLLVATGRRLDEINSVIGSDSLGYLSVEHVQQLAPASKCGFCTGCFTGSYPIDPPEDVMDTDYDRPISTSNKPEKSL